MCWSIRNTLGICKGWHVGVGEIQVVCQFGVLAGYRGYALHAGQDALLLTVLPNLQILFLHVAALWLQDEAGNLEVGESTPLNL